MDSYVSGNKEPDDFGKTNSTVKRCMPVFDAMTSGYIITTYVDIWIKQKQILEGSIKIDFDSSKTSTQPFYVWPSENPIEFHPIIQAPNHPNRGTHLDSYPKWINAWSISTPEGYSTLFVQPFHRESPFTILPGVVDTDKYKGVVNFPFVLNDADNFTGLIPAGTPIVQVIPFKRDQWKMEIGSDQDLKEQQKDSNKIRRKFFDSYKNEFRQTKEYK
jgi:hypothetical protein